MRMSEWQKTRISSSWLGYMVICLQSIVCSLLVYALIIGGGDIVVAGCKKIGFYNFSLYNKTLDGCYFITQLEDLPSAGETTRRGLVLAIILTYSSLVTVIMGVLTAMCAQCFQDGVLWKFALVLNVLSLAGLCLGMTTYLFFTWDLFDISQVTPGFLALLLAAGGLSLLCCMMSHYTRLTCTRATSESRNADDELLFFKV
ncbi:transmembrane protein 140 [Pseudophryne corroboree]|uniref:transmembrane protein 140 n=1 Tax=Pseudophryne corroboree TaxID=495146 RepID=UPI00308161A0